jgi:hypothetical protein
MEILRKYFHWFTGLFIFIIYLTTLAPTVIQIDSGELSAVQATLGIAHPTGYPLFTILGYIFTQIPLPFRDIYKLNILAALWCAGGIVVFTYTLKLVLDNINKFRTIKKNLKAKKIKKKKSQSIQQRGKEVVAESENQLFAIPESKKYFAAITSGLFLAFSRTYWFQSTSVEVYSLHVFLLSLIIFFLIKAFIEENNNGRLTKNWILFTIFLALGFTNHMTTLLILPGVAYFYFSKFGFNKSSFIRILLMLVIFFPVLIIMYSYLPIRASQNPILNWGNPVDLERIIRHISGKQYQVWIFSSTEAAKKQLEYFINSLPLEFSVSLLIAAIGLIYSFLISKKIGVFILICFISTVLYSINYDINDIDSYFLLAYISAAFFSTLGIIKLLSFLKFKKFSYLIAASVISLFILVQAVIVYPKVDQSSTYAYEDYAYELIGSVTKDAIIFSYQWDFFISASYYLQFAEGFRKDVKIVDKELLRRSWYFNQLDRAYPGILDGIRTEMKLFLDALAPFERSEKHDPNLLEMLYRRLMTNLISTNIDKRDFYVAPELFQKEMQKGEFTLPEGYKLVPDLFLFRVVKGDEYVPAADPDFKIRFPEERNFYLDQMINSFICNMLIHRAFYELQFDKIDRANLYIGKIKKDFPEYVFPPGIEQALKRSNEVTE